MPATAAETYRYEVETDQGTFAVELDQEIPDTPEGMRLLQSLVHQQLADREFDRRNYPVSTAIGDVARGLLGGARDLAQGVIDLPTSVFNTWTSFVSPDPPGGPPGSRRRLIPEIPPPVTLPDLAPESGLESGVRLGTAIGGGVAAHAIGIPAARQILGRLTQRLLGKPRPTPMLFEPPLTVAEPPPVPRLWETPPPATGVSKALSPDAAAIARRILDVPFSPDQLAKMSPEQAFQALKRLRARFPEWAQARDAARHLDAAAEQDAAMHLRTWERAQRRRRGRFSEPNITPPLSRGADPPASSADPIEELAQMLESVLYRR